MCMFPGNGDSEGRVSHRLLVHSVLRARAAYRPAHIPMNINEGTPQVLYGVKLPPCMCVKAWSSD